jgi:curved DNA-binding protein CbpA
MRVRRSASKKKLKEAYRRLAKRVHPDKTADERAGKVSGGATGVMGREGRRGEEAT